MTFYETFLLTVFDALMALLIIHGIKKGFSTSILNKFLFIVVTSTIIAIVSANFANEQLSHLFCVVFELLIVSVYLYLNGEKSIIKSVLLFFTMMIMLIVVQLLSVILIVLINGNLDYTFLNGVLSQTISLILMIALTRFAPLKKIDDFIVNNNVLFAFIITTSFMLYYGVTIIWYGDIDLVTSTPLGAIILVMLAVAVNAIILREGFVNQMYKNKLKVLETYNPIVEEMIDELRTKQHDYHNHIQALISMRLNETIAEEEIVKYAQDVCKDDILNILSRVDNRIVGAFLHSKISEARKNSIEVVLNIEDTIPDTVFETYEVIELYGILIDNAFDAVKSDKDVASKVYITIKKEEGKSVLEVRNKHKYVSVKEIQRFFQKGHSTKKEQGHGIGLYKLKKTLEKKEGAIQFSYDTDREHVVAGLYLA